ncbi:CpaD family pilus assembly protein [Sphingomonas sp. RP10(2022)]|uniref:CpaD family pilus assembly protein n=1 Tax=Sphingomonas liriopis TaxID=2949094 RepID=A0A9X2HSR1_9SPHN|nr:CpaD family pilus assembly protein [Sphingomonas liriopis]MCP3735202.1 CpaD family pilus assembly protein [Sphingomonas liriopis]
MTQRSILLAALAAPALLLGGCMGTDNRGLESVHQPVVAQRDFALDLATAGGRLAPGESRRLGGWMTAMHLGYGDRVAIDEAGDAPPAARDQIAAVVASYGLLLSDDRPVTPAPVTPGTLRIVVSRMHASVPGCPDWSRDSSHEFEGSTSSNYGCAVNTNLAAMIARPADLVRGVDHDPITDPALTTKAIEAYRKKPATGAAALEQVSAKGAN